MSGIIGGCGGLLVMKRVGGKGRGPGLLLETTWSRGAPDPPTQAPRVFPPKLATYFQIVHCKDKC